MRVQFAGVPWLRDHLAGLLRELLASLEVKIDPTRLLRLPSRDDLRSLVDAVREGGLIELVAAPGSARRSSTASRRRWRVLEGHAEHVMDAVGARARCPRSPGCAPRWTVAARERSAPARLLERLLGLEMKMRQYELGKAFCDGVVEREGVEALNRVWEAPEMIPTLVELEDPGSWLARTRVPSVTKSGA